MPADHNLRRRFTVLIRQIANDFLIENACAALRQRAPGLGLDLVRRIPGMQLTLLHQRMQFDLVDHRCNAGFIDQTLEVVYLEVTHADAFHQPLFLQFNHPFPGVNIMVDSRNGPVHQIEIEVIQLELIQAFLQGFSRAFLIVIPQFGGNKQLFPVDTGIF